MLFQQKEPFGPNYDMPKRFFIFYFPTILHFPGSNTASGRKYKNTLPDNPSPRNREKSCVLIYVVQHAGANPLYIGTAPQHTPDNRPHSCGRLPASADSNRIHAGCGSVLLLRAASVCIAIHGNTAAVAAIHRFTPQKNAACCSKKAHPFSGKYTIP